MNYRVKKYKAQRNKMNKLVKKYNLSLDKDEAFGGRFCVREITYNYIPFEDDSGCTMNVAYRFYDRKTGNAAIAIFDNYNYRWELVKYLNDFVIRCRDGQSGHFPELNWLFMNIPVYYREAYGRWKEAEGTTEYMCFNRFYKMKG